METKVRKREVLFDDASLDPQAVVAAAPEASAAWRALVQPVVVFTVAIALMIMGHLGSGGYMAALWQATLAFLAGASALGWTLITQPLADIRDAARGLASGSAWNEATRAKVKRLGQGIRSSGILTGALGTALGLVSVFANIPDPSRLGSGVSVHYVAVLYGAFVVLLGASVEAAAETRGARRTWLLPSGVRSVAVGVVAILAGVAILGLFKTPDVPVDPILGLMVLGAGLMPLAFDSFDRRPRSVAARLGYIALSLVPGGVIASTLGMIHVMQNLSDPSLLYQGVAMAASPIPLAILGYAIARAAAARLDPDGSAIRDQQHLTTLLVGTGALALLYAEFALILLATS